MILKPWQWRKYKSGTISLCMIMKNEEQRLARCLESVRGLVHEIIIVDTGSSDNSCDIAKRLGAKVLHHRWDDDFAAARNVSLRAATCDWILTLDPDEVISKKDHDAIREYTYSNRFVAYRLNTRNYSDIRMQQDFHPNPNDYEEGKGWPGFMPSIKTRLWRNGLGIHFQGIWHELVDWYLDAHSMPVMIVPTPIHHFHREIMQKSFKEKAEFYHRLGLKKVQQWPFNPKAWHELFVSCMIRKDYRKAAFCVAKTLKLGYSNSKQFFSQARALNEIGAKDLGTLAFEKGICLLYPNLTHIDPTKKTTKDLII